MAWIIAPDAVRGVGDLSVLVKKVTGPAGAVRRR